MAGAARLLLCVDISNTYIVEVSSLRRCPDRSRCSGLSACEILNHGGAEDMEIYLIWLSLSPMSPWS